MVEIVFPADAARRIVKGRRFKARFAQNAAEPVGAGTGRVANGRPDWPAISRRPDGEVLVGHRTHDLSQTPVVLRPAVVEQPDRHRPPNLRPAVVSGVPDPRNRGTGA